MLLTIRPPNGLAPPDAASGRVWRWLGWGVYQQDRRKDDPMIPPTAPHPTPPVGPGSRGRWGGMATRPVALALTVAVLVFAGALAGLGPREAFAAFVNARGGRDVVFGPDNDNTANPLIQPPGTAANQSLNNTDIQLGGPGNDVLIGLQGSDVQLGQGGDDILVGGTEQFVTPNSDIQFGGPGDDVSIWAPGDGSDFFEGGPGRDAQVFGVIDRDPDNIPILTGGTPGFPRGIPTANVTESPGFCTLEQVPAASDLGYEFLVRFFVRATGALAVTIRLVDVEQVFCTSREGGQIIFADLKRAQPQFEVVSLDQVERLNPLVRRIIR
jgi:hypothetical protein